MPNDKPWSALESHKAWMSVRDADLYESLVRCLAGRYGNHRFCVLEWGAGRSTLWYTRLLDTLGIAYCWLTLEHHREYFERELADEIRRRPNATIVYSEDIVPRPKVHLSQEGITAVIFNAGELLPFRPDREEDRKAPLDDYVSLPARTGLKYDLIVVDGRKRRRCTLEAARILKSDGYVVLHDAWRPYYQCAWRAFRSGRRFGDEWWIGSLKEANFHDVLPPHAFDASQEMFPRRELEKVLP